MNLTLFAAAAGLVLDIPAHAQMNMNMPGMSTPGMKMPAKKPSTGKAATWKSASKKTGKTSGRATRKGEPAASAPAHHPKPRSSDHDMSTMPGGHDMKDMPGMARPSRDGLQNMPGTGAPAATDKSSMPGMPMTSGQDMNGMPGMGMPPGPDMKDLHGMALHASPEADASGTNLAAGNAPPPPVPTDHAADQVYGAAVMAMGLHHLQEFHGGQKMSQLLVNIAEYHFNRRRDGYQWVGQGWYGGDLNRLWFKSQGDGEVRRGVSRAEVQGLFSHAIGPYFNLQGGVRYDFKPNPSRTYATVGIEGLAPSFFDIEAALFLSNKGELMGRLEGTVDQRITQKLILQPRVEVNAAAQSSRSIGVGSGLSDVEAGLRLRYDIRREFSPYLGVQYKRAFGTTAHYLSDAGERRGGWSFVTGIRTWF